jgi:hypothetical protein
MAPGWEDVHVVTTLEELLRAIRAGKVEVASSLIGLGHSSSQLVAVRKEFISRRIVLIIPGRINTSEAPQVFLKTLDAIEEFKHCVAQEPSSWACQKRGGMEFGLEGQRPSAVIVRMWPNCGREGFLVVLSVGVEHPEFDSVQDYWPARRRRVMSQEYGARTASYRESRKLRICLFCSSGSAL